MGTLLPIPTIMGNDSFPPERFGNGNENSL